MVGRPNWTSYAFTDIGDATSEYAVRRDDLVGALAGKVAPSIRNRLRFADADKAIADLFRTVQDSNVPLQDTLIQFAQSREDMWHILKPAVRPSSSSAVPPGSASDIPARSAATYAPQQALQAPGQSSPPSSFTQDSVPYASPQTPERVESSPLNANENRVIGESPMDRVSLLSPGSSPDQHLLATQLRQPPSVNVRELDAELGGHQLRLDCKFLRFDSVRNWWTIFWQLQWCGDKSWRSLQIKGTVTEARGQSCRIIALAPHKKYNDPGEPVTKTGQWAVHASLNASHVPATIGGSFANALAETSRRTIRASQSSTTEFEIELGSSDAGAGLMSDVAWGIAAAAPRDAQLGIDLSINGFKKQTGFPGLKVLSKPSKPYSVSRSRVFTIADERGAEEMEAQTVLNKLFDANS